MVAGFHYGIENVAEVDVMPAPAAIANVDARPWYIVGRDVSHRDAMRHVDLDGRSLLFYPAGAVNEAILYSAFFRIIVRLGATREIELIDGTPIVVAKQRIGDRVRVTYKCDAVGAGLSQMTANGMKTAVVVADKDAIAAKLIEDTFLDLAIFRAGKEHRTPTVDAPVAAQEGFARLHKRARRMAESEVAKVDPLYWRFHRATHLHKMLQPYYFHHSVL